MVAARISNTPTTLLRDADAKRAYEASQAMLGPHPRLAYAIIWERGALTGIDLNEHHRKVSGKTVPLHTYLDDLAALGWIRRVGRGNSATTGKPGALWDITGRIGSRVKDKNREENRLPVMEVVASMIGYVGSRESEGATYYEWWTWFRASRAAVLASDAATQYFGTLSARWKELQRVNVLVPSDVFRSQQDATKDPALRAQRSNKPARVFLLRKGASVVDYIKGDKKAPPTEVVQLTNDEAAILAEYRRMRQSWSQVTTHQQQERLLLRLATFTATTLNDTRKKTKEAA